MARALGERSFGGHPQLEVLGKVLKSYLLSKLLQVCFQVLQYCLNNDARRNCSGKLFIH